MRFEFGLIGYPIKYSLSPWIHQTFLERANVHGHYRLMEIDPEDSFHRAIESLKSKKLNGFNVTVPFKEKIIPYLDELDELAKQVGAVNTVVSRNGKWFGYNTDGLGYVRSLLEHYPSLNKNKDKKIILLGAGGAAKGIFTALVKSGFSNVTIANRTIERAHEIISNELTNIKYQIISLKAAEKRIDEYDVIIQTTSVGMKPNDSDMVIRLNKLKNGAIVSDIVYQPLFTAFLKRAKSLGANIHYGHTMLLYQALYAFEIWTKHTIEIKDMEDKLKKILEG